MTIFWEGKIIILFPDHFRGRVNKTLFILPLQKEGKYISSYVWLL